MNSIGASLISFSQKILVQDEIGGEDLIVHEGVKTILAEGLQSVHAPAAEISDAYDMKDET